MIVAWVNYELIYKGSLGTEREEINSTVTIKDAEGNPICFETTTIIYGDEGGSNVSGRIEIPEPKFWWPLGMNCTPGYRYEVEVSLKI